MCIVVFMRGLVFPILCVASIKAETACTHYNVTSIPDPNGVDVFTFKSSHIQDTSDVVHCTTVWPNDEPGLAMYPIPPGCMRLNPRNGMAFNVSNAMKVYNELGRLVHVEWTPEWEFPDHPHWGPDAAHRMSIPVSNVMCEKYYSRTTLGATGQTVIVGKGCTWMHRDACKFLGQIHSTSTCSRNTETGRLIEATGFHRTLAASINTHGRQKYAAWQWLPRQWFAETDELERRTRNMSRSISFEVNIENPSAVSPAQLVWVKEYPIPVHSRVNPPLKDASQTHFVTKIPDPVWMTVDNSGDDCAVETNRLSDLVKIPPQYLFQFSKDQYLVRTKNEGTERYFPAVIPTGKSDDLFQVVVITAVSAMGGALGIVLASIL
jgi:hypothetical protein